MHFLKLIRPVNLLVIALTMYGVRVFFLQNAPVFRELNHGFEPFDYFLLVLSTLMIAAGGNIINDYFDVKADRINKPGRLIIGKYIKPRWAIVTHWAFNFTAFAIAAYLSWRYETFWYVFVHLLTINALWFYSMYFKRRFLIGNLIIAGLTALVPILCGIHFYVQAHNTFTRDYLPSIWQTTESSWIFELFYHGLFIYILAIFAFSLNFVREIVKDIQDIQGDIALHAKTLPIVLGAERTKWIAIVLLVLILVTGAFFVLQWEQAAPFAAVGLPATIIALLSLCSLFLLLRSSERKMLKRADFFLKLAMMAGCCTPYYWYFLL